VLRLLRMLRRFRTFELLLSAIGLALEALPALLFVFLLLALIFSTLIYVVEPRTNIGSWPEAMWLTVISMTTVGFGDVIPASDEGRIIVSVLVVVSLLYLSMPIGILGDAFKTIWNDRHRILVIRQTRGRFIDWGFVPKDIPKLFARFDLDEDGMLNLVDFRAMMKQINIGLHEEWILDLFHCFDTNMTGYIGEKEFVRSMFPYHYCDIYSNEFTQSQEEERCALDRRDEGAWMRRLSTTSIEERLPSKDRPPQEEPSSLWESSSQHASGTEGSQSQTA